MVLCIFGLLVFGFSAFLRILLADNRWRILLNLPTRVTPYHNVTDKDKCLVIFKGLFHHVEPELNIGHICLIDVVYKDLTLLSGFFGEEFGFLSFEDFLDAVGLDVEGVLHGAHVDWVFDLLLDELTQEGCAEGGVEVVDEVLFGHCYDLSYVDLSYIIWF